MLEGTYLEHGIASKAIPPADLDPGRVDLPGKDMVPLPPGHLSKAQVGLDTEGVELEGPLGIAPRQVELVQLVVAPSAITERLVVDGVITSGEDAFRSLAGAGPHDLIHEVVRAAPPHAVVIVLAGALPPGAILGVGAGTRVYGLDVSDGD